MISDALFEREELDDYRLLIRKNTDVSFVTKNKNEKKEESSLSDSKPDEKRVREIHTVIPDGFYGACPFNLSVKTNLLPYNQQTNHLKQIYLFVRKDLWH